MVRRLILFFAGIALLNGALTMVNSWPTAWVRPTALVAPELVALVLLIALLVGIHGRLGEVWHWVISVAVLLLIGGRYGVVTTEGLFGRPVNLYWEAVRLPDVAALMLDATPLWLLVAGAAVGGAAVLGLVLATGWCVRAVAAGLGSPKPRKWTIWVCVLLLAGFSLGQRQSTGETFFARAVVPAYGRQLGLVFDHTLHPRLAMADTGSLGVGRGVSSRDVYIIFLESYGATVFDDPGRKDALDGAYGALEAVLDGSPWSAVSAFVDSTTFGGASWLAHTSLLSGRPIGDQRDYLSLIESGQALLPREFQAAGYRSIALVPGITRAWPEGRAFGYDRIYDAAAIGYEGPRFGWWDIPDQYSLALLQDREIEVAGRAPLFVFYPTVMSHMPFAPTPPYATDWRQLPEVYERVSVEDQSGDRGEAYTAAVRYNLAVLGGFLGQRVDDDAVLIVLGDHQPPALVSGPNAPWAVPVHVFSSDPAALAAFEALGFQPGVRPERAVVGGIADLTGAVQAAAGAS